MTNQNNSLFTLSILLAFSFFAMAEGTTEKLPKFETKRINADYRIAKNKCSLLSGVAEKNCITLAKENKSKAIANTTKSLAKTSNTCAPYSNKTIDTDAKPIDENYKEEIESVVTEVKPTDSEIQTFGIDIFRDRIQYLAIR
jgi:hypothetical protein